ncbi:MAG: hypothetical protein CSA42_00770 [Gammaproteobacteria bacterium]|nr:MAG: hypothetical protein CSA42_00770 [Gammaproteobacteria bacterium]
MITKPKHLLFAPLLWQQGKRVKKDTPSLPEPTGDRHGIVALSNSNDKTDKHKVYRLMVVGDSSAAGVGVDTQDEALTQQLVANLTQQTDFCQNYTHIDWQLHATTGHTSFDVLRRLYVLTPSPKPIDLMVIIVGINDTTSMLSLKNWKTNIQEIITVAQLKHRPKSIIFSALPPIRYFPALPVPLNRLIGDKAEQLDSALAEICTDFNNVHYTSFNLPFDLTKRQFTFRANKQPDTNIAKYFAIDGFHPSGLTYQYWAKQLAEAIVRF